MTENEEFTPHTEVSNLEPVVNLEEHFQKTTEEKPEDEGQFQEIEQEQKTQEIKEKQEQEGAYNFGDSAENIVDMVDQIQQIVFPFMHQMALMNSDDRKALKLLSRRMREAMRSTDKKDKEITLTLRDQDLLELKEEMDDYEEDLPFTEKERNTLKRPLKDLLTKSNFKMSPGSALTWSTVIVMLPRIIPMIAGRVQRAMK